ncbi:MAG: ATP-binding protein [Acidobacteriota bacterium]
MMGREGERWAVPIAAVVIRQQAQQVIRHLVDAVVELVTNADDSYRRLEEAEVSPSGRIDIRVKRHKAGEWEYLAVEDQAEGMDLDRLKAIATYGVTASGFEAGRSVRGMFGRGLKEAAIAVGEAYVRSVQHGREYEVKLFWDETKHEAAGETLKDGRPIKDSNGTRVTLVPRKDCPLKCLMFEKFYDQVANHFALRDINQNRHRQVYVTVENVGGGRGKGARTGRETRRVRYEPPKAKDVYRHSLKLTGLGSVIVEICEAEEKLEFSPYDPCSKGGLIVRTEGAALDLRVPGYENYEAARYFFGTVFCPAIARRIRSGDYGLVDADRSGLQWRHRDCSELYEEVRKFLKPQIERKQRELASGPPAEVPEERRKKLRAILALLNRLAREELEVPPKEGGEDGEELEEIVDLTIKPEKGNALPKQPRTFSVYLPRSFVSGNGGAAVIYLELMERVGNVRLFQAQVPLTPHSKREGLLVGRFLVAGDHKGDKAFVLAKFGASHEDMAEFCVQAPKPRKRPEDLAGRKGGMFSGFDWPVDKNPQQRVSYEDGVIRVFLNFPSVGRYLGPGGKGMEEPQGSLMLAELVAEAFCREMARRKLPERPVAPAPEAQVDNFNAIVNELRAKHLGAVHRALVVK